MDEDAQATQEARRPWPFRTRWRIEGCLVTESGLHIGSGHATRHPEIKDGDKPVEISAIVRDHENAPMIPGATLKGNLRAGLAHHSNRDLLNRVFGQGPSTDNSNNGGRGGSAEFHDARLVMPRRWETPLPWWDETRQAWIEIGNAINRSRATVEENKLFHREVVPAGVGFQVVITGMFENEEEVALLLAALEGFNASDDEGRVTIGADTHSGKGRCRWELGEIYRLDRDGVKAWVRDQNRGCAEHCLPAIDDDKRLALLKKAKALRQSNQKDTLALDITLRFKGPFLVNDPPGEKEKLKEKDERLKPPDARPRTNETGDVVLPERSFRGSLRAQAERILRTMVSDDVFHDRGKLHRIVCRPEVTELACGPIHNEKELDKLCLPCRLFGAPGWRSPLEIRPFELQPSPSGYEQQVQEFIAIDRFTGGGLSGAKFNALAIYSPVFKGQIILDRSRMPCAWARGLLALTLRDLIEGDITFGYGAAKGYGACTAEVNPWSPEAFGEKSVAILRETIKQRLSAGGQNDA